MLFLGLHELFVLMSHFLYVSISNYKAPEGVLSPCLLYYPLSYSLK